MGYPREIYQQASAVLSARRQQANEQTLMHRREIYALLPQIEKYDKELAQIGMKTIQAVAGSPDRGNHHRTVKAAEPWTAKAAGRSACSGGTAGGISG